MIGHKCISETTRVMMMPNALEQNPMTTWQRDMVFSVTYYLHLYNAINCLLETSFLFTTNVKLGCLGIREYGHLYLVKIYISNEKL